MEEKIFTGVAEDNRTPQEKLKNWPHEELFGMGMVEWMEKDPATWKNFPIRNQNGSGMCGPFSTCKALGINNFRDVGEYVNLNTAFIYQKRLNQDSAGMIFYDMLGLACNEKIGGAPLDPTLSSDNINDQQAMAMHFTEEQKKDALKYRGKNYLFIVDRNIDSVAQVVANGWTPILLLRCNFSEWGNVTTVDPNVKEWTDYNIHHYVPVVDYTMYKGQKCLIIEDSWGQQYGNKGRRIVTEEFFKKRVYDVGYVIDLPNVEVSTKPKHTFIKELSYGLKNNAEVKTLQDILKYEKFFPNVQDSTGNFLSITAAALKKWQVAHGIMDFANENDVRKIRFGKQSIKMANSLYS